MIRKFRPSDLDQTVDIWLKASIESHGFIPGEFWESKVNDMRDIYLPSAVTHVFEEKNELKGFVSLLGDTLAALFVAPCEQGKGIGKQLMTKAKAIRGKLTLTVYEENRKSVAFYKRNGFKVVQSQIDHHTGHRELLMEFHP